MTRTVLTAVALAALLAACGETAKLTPADQDLVSGRDAVSGVAGNG